MAESNWPIVLIEGVLVLGGTLAFGWWQLRSVKRDQQLAAARREERLREEARQREQGLDDAGAPAGGDAGEPGCQPGTADAADAAESEHPPAGRADSSR